MTSLPSFFASVRTLSQPVCAAAPAAPNSAATNRATPAIAAAAIRLETQVFRALRMLNPSLGFLGRCGCVAAFADLLVDVFGEIKIGLRFAGLRRAERLGLGERADALGNARPHVLGR